MSKPQSPCARASQKRSQPLSRPGGPARETSAQPGRAGINPEDDLSAVGAALEALALPALKRVMRVETLSRSAKALLPPHKCGGSHRPRSYRSPSLLPGGNNVPPLVAGSVQHVDTSGVHMLGHLEDLIEFVVQGRFASRSGQRIFTRSQSKFVCTHNEYWYTSVWTYRKCANLTITRPQRGQRASPLDHTLGYP